ncbi:peptidoglycan-binding protein [Oscillatoria sp. FACHB-1407]|uniref:peptidoglycan-binding domain-containing protein n=1 Tax=Oscillatoria sp. FACHB-1407 TaxID=2692847 RepID=UPI00168863A7|nr:peptidoglycan-binding protein [Oscillatoria sp. FACHB-1407]MBD2461580.1 peptidoglycan-binding protein [Oscillatoria sp. FACHB-1407]
METVAYLYAATAYEESEIASDGMDVEFATVEGINWHQISAQTATSVLAIACSLSVLSTAGVASALQRNDSGTDVTTLQSDLIQAGYYDGPVTGFYGELTETAVARFQSENGLLVDGIAGSETLTVLQNRLAAVQAPSNSAGGTLRHGDQGTAVTDLQNRLRSAGYFNGPVTGYYGSLTEAAVMRFQDQKGLVVDGEAGTQTLKALRQTGTANRPTSGQGGPATTVSNGVLERGDRGTAVADLQNRLRNAGYFEGPMTGFYGSLTEEAVTKFQRAKGLTIDGKAGPRTLGALLQSPNSQQTQPQANQPSGNQRPNTAQRPSPQPTSQASAQPNTAQPNAAQPNAAQPNAAQPNAAQPNTTQPNATQPNPTQSQTPTATTPPAPTATVPTLAAGDVLERGDGGPEVAALQTALKQANYLNGQVTGFFGQLTEQAVIKFQSENGLPATGKVDAATLEALQNRTRGANDEAILEKGDSGAAVADLQNRLRNAGFFDGPMTGYYGDFTEQAVAEFQRAKGLTVDGKAGARTLAALR